MKGEVVFADTNLFLRYLTNDIPAQADAVESLLKRAAKSEILLTTTSLVIAEIVWTLESFYHLAKKDISGKVLAILNTHGLNVEDSDLLLQAAVWYAEKNVDFIDAFNAAWLLQQDISRVATFDLKHFNRFDGLIVEAP
jgi:predicted nucleic-acid-binding protein